MNFQIMFNNYFITAAITFTSLFTGTLSLATGSFSAADANVTEDATTKLSKLEIVGAVQLWHRTCDTPAGCSLPIAIGTAKLLKGEIEAPIPGQGATLSLDTTITSADAGEFGEWQIVVQVFRKTKSNPNDTSYTAYQVTLKKKNTGKAAFLCSSYEPEQLIGLFFPVGACGGELPGSDGKYMIGVSFYRG